MMSFRWMASLSMVLLLVVASCGEAAVEEPQGAVAALAAPARTYTSAEVADALLIEFRDVETAGVALLSAIDRGYSLPVTVRAATGGQLDEDGLVYLQDGRLVIPANVDTAVIADKLRLTEQMREDAVAEASLASYQQRPINVTTSELRDALRTVFGDDVANDQAGAAGLKIILDRLAQGFSAEQAISAFVLGIPLRCDIFDPEGYNELACTLDGETPAGEPIDTLLGGPRDDRDAEELADELAGDDDAFDIDAAEESSASDESNRQLAWSGEVSVTGYEDRRLYEDPIVIITINRVEGTDDYQGEFFLEIAGPWGEACSQVNTYHFIGQGTASATSPPAQIVMTGRQTESYVRGDCTAQWADQAVERSDETEVTILLSLTNEGISGSWFSAAVTEFLLPSD